MLSVHLTKAVLTLALITTSDDPLSSFSISFTGSNGTFSILFNRTVTVVAISFSIKGRSNWGPVKRFSVMIWSFNPAYFCQLSLNLSTNRSSMPQICIKEVVFTYIRIKLNGISEWSCSNQKFVPTFNKMSFMNFLHRCLSK